MKNQEEKRLKLTTGNQTNNQQKHSKYRQRQHATMLLLLITIENEINVDVVLPFNALWIVHRFWHGFRNGKITFTVSLS